MENFEFFDQPISFYKIILQFIFFKISIFKILFIKLLHKKF